MEVGDTDATTPATSVEGRAASVTVAGCPTAIFVASASAKPATTSSRWRLSMVTKAVEDDELDEAFDELDDAFEEAFEAELGELFEFELDEELSLPPTVSPTEPL